jgi:hypothetical protein
MFLVAGSKFSREAEDFVPLSAETMQRLNAIIDDAFAARKTQTANHT